MKKHIVGVLISIVTAELVGAISGLLSGDIKSVYASLALPPLSPPGWVFPVAWGILYALMGIASYLVFVSDRDHKTRKTALALYSIQLFINFWWSIVFFRFQAYGAGVIILVLLIIAVVATMIKFSAISRPAMYLLIPYLLWLLYAGYLATGIYWLNK